MTQVVKIRKESVFRFVCAALLALTLTLLLYLAGTAVGRQLFQMQKEYRVELFNRAVEEQGLVVKMISDEEIQSVTTKYIAALADAVVRFEFFPRDDDATNFFEIVSVLPGDVKIDRFEFSGRNLSITCAAGTENALRLFSQSLGSLACFQDTSVESYQKKDGSFVGTITCIAV